MLRRRLGAGILPASSCRKYELPILEPVHLIKAVIAIPGTECALRPGPRHHLYSVALVENQQAGEMLYIPAASGRKNPYAGTKVNPLENRLTGDSLEGL